MSAVFALWPDLPPLPKLLLVWMALVSLDNESKSGRPPRVYFDGEESLIAAGGRSRPQTYDALRVLREAGAIEVVQAGRLRFRAVYRLRLDPLDGAREGAENRTQEGAENRTQLRAVRRTWRVRRTAPLGSTEGGSKESRGGEISSEATVSPTPVDNSGDEHEIDLSAARQIVGEALSIEQAAARIRELAADGTDYAEAYIALAHEIEKLTGGNTP